MNLKQCMLIKNDCYTRGIVMDNKQPKGIVVHSTGCNQTWLGRFVNPVRGQENYDELIKDLGRNIFLNSWNRSMGTSNKCVHAMIGKNDKGTICTYQTLPFEYVAAGVGSGTKGSYNYNPTAHIQFEILEDNLKNEDYFYAVMREAQEFCAYLCTEFNLSVDSIVSHYEASKLGYANNHGDIDHWLTRYGKTMEWFRDEVRKILEPKVIYRVQVGAFSNYKYAEALVKELEEKGYTPFIAKCYKE